MNTGGTRFQKSHKQNDDDREENTHPGHFAELDDEHKKQMAELEAILEQSTDFLSEKDIKNIKKMLKILNKKLLQELKEALINKQMAKFRAIEVEVEGDDTNG